MMRNRPATDQRIHYVAQYLPAPRPSPLPLYNTARYRKRHATPRDIYFVAPFFSILLKKLNRLTRRESHSLVRVVVEHRVIVIAREHFSFLISI